MSLHRVEPAEASNDFAIQTYQLTKIFNSVVAVDSIKLNIKKGEKGRWD